MSSHIVSCNVSAGDEVENTVVLTVKVDDTVRSVKLGDVCSLTNSSGVAVSGRAEFVRRSRQITFTPSAPLPAGSYTFSLDAEQIAGELDRMMGDWQVSFTVKAAPSSFRLIVRKEGEETSRFIEFTPGGSPYNDLLTAVAERLDVNRGGIGEMYVVPHTDQDAGVTRVALDDDEDCAHLEADDEIVVVMRPPPDTSKDAELAAALQRREEASVPQHHRRDGRRCGVM